MVGKKTVKKATISEKKVEKSPRKERGIGASKPEKRVVTATGWKKMQLKKSLNTNKQKKKRPIA